MSSFYLEYLTKSQTVETLITILFVAGIFFAAIWELMPRLVGDQGHPKENVYAISVIITLLVLVVMGMVAR